MGISVVIPASTGCFQICTFYLSGLNFKVTWHYCYVIVRVFFILCCQNLLISSHCLSGVDSAIAYFSKITLRNQVLYFPLKCRILFIKVFPCIFYCDGCIPWCNLDRHILCSKILISGSGCFHTDCLHTVCHIGYAWCFRSPAAVSSFVVYSISFCAFDLPLRFMCCSIICPATAFCLKFCTFNAGCFNFKIARLHGDCIVGICFIICSQYVRIEIYCFIAVRSSVTYFPKIACCY